MSISTDINYQQNIEFSSEYLKNLTSLGYDRITREPGLLYLEESKLTNQIKEIVSENYNLIFNSAKAVKSVNENLSKTVDELQPFENSLKELKTSIATLQNEASQQIHQKSITKLVEMQLPFINELLEVPQMIETCIENDWNEDASALISALKNKIHQIKSTKAGECNMIKILENALTEKSALYEDALLQKLEAEFREDNSKQIVENLLKLDGRYTEQQLRIIFLKRRSSFISNYISKVEATIEKDALLGLKDMLELLRTFVHDSATQFGHLFGDGDELLSNWLLKYICLTSNLLERHLLPPSHLQHQLTPSSSSRINIEKLKREDAVFWRSPPFNAAAIAALYRQSHRCAAAFVSLNASFFNTITPIFDTYLELYIHEWLDRSLTIFQHECSTYNWIASSIHVEATISENEIEDAADAPFRILRDKLQKYRPLAAFAEEFILMFNELRQCALLSMKRTICRMIQDTLQSAVHVLHASKIQMNAKQFDNKKQTTFHLKISGRSNSNIAKAVEASSVDFSNLCKSFAQQLLDLIAFIVHNIYGDTHNFNKRSIVTSMVALELYEAE